jgi:hypothetical protein
MDSSAHAAAALVVRRAALTFQGRRASSASAVLALGNSTHRIS